MPDHQWLPSASDQEDEDTARRQAEADAESRDLEIEGHCIAAAAVEGQRIRRELLAAIEGSAWTVPLPGSPRVYPASVVNGALDRIVPEAKS